MQQNDFEQVDLNTFFDTQSLAADQNEKAEMLTTQQKQLIQEVMPLIKEYLSEGYLLKAKDSFCDLFLKETGKLMYE